MYSEPRGRRWDRILLASIVLLGLAARIFGCWCYRYAVNVDHAVVALMSKHMAEGKSWPVFFYGQSYMGSFEQWASVPFQRFFPSLLSLSICAPIFGILGLWAVYAVARRLAGRIAGLAAAIYCIIGPKGYFHYQSSPRDYTTILLLSLLILDRAAAALRHWERDQRWRMRDLFILGVVVGLGWWCSALTVNATLAAVVVLLVFGGWRLAGHPLAMLSGFAGTLLGAAPWLVWNVRNQWASLAATGSFDPSASLSNGLKLFFGDRLSRILQVAPLPPLAFWLTVLIYGAALLLVIALTTAYVATKDRRRFLACALLLFIPVSAILYSVTEFQRFNTARYQLPMVPIAAIAIGTMTSMLMRLKRKWLAVLPLLAVVLPFSVNIPTFWTRLEEDSALAKDGSALISELREKKVETAYADHMARWLNVLADESPAFVPIRNLRYQPYGFQAEQDASPAFINGYLGIEQFLAATGGSAKRINGDEFSALYDIHRPATDVQALPLEGIASVTLGDRDIQQTVCDDMLGTSVILPQGRVTLTAELAVPAQISGIRAWLPRRIDACSWKIEALRPEDGTWNTVMPSSPATCYRWSGPRVFPHGVVPLLEASFKPCRVAALRITFKTKKERSPGSISEIALYAPHPNPHSGAAEITEAAKALRKTGAELVYADRWEAARLRELLPDSMHVIRQMALTREESEARPEHIRGDRSCALLLPRSEINASMRAIDLIGQPQTLRQVGRYALVTMPASDKPSPLLWSAGRVLIASPWQLANTLASRSGGTAKEQAALLQRAAALDPGRRDIRKKLTKLLETTGSAASPAVPPFEAPRTELNESYRIGARLIGISMDQPPPQQPGQSVTLKTFWTLEKPIKTDSLALFVHIRRNGKTRFQADHTWLEGVTTEEPAHPDRVLVDTATIQIPADTKPGELTLHIGLVDRASASRLPREGFLGNRGALQLAEGLVISP